MVAIIRGTKSETVIEALRHIPQEQLETVKKVTLDLSDSMRKIYALVSPMPLVLLIVSIFRNLLAMQCKRYALSLDGMLSKKQTMRWKKQSTKVSLTSHTDMRTGIPRKNCWQEADIIFVIQVGR